MCLMRISVDRFKYGNLLKIRPRCFQMSSNITDTSIKNKYNIEFHVLNIMLRFNENNFIFIANNAKETVCCVGRG